MSDTVTSSRYRNRTPSLVKSWPFALTSTAIDELEFTLACDLDIEGA
jgi:hypothetical protein